MADDILDDFLVPRGQSEKLLTRLLLDGRVVQLMSTTINPGVGDQMRLNGKPAPDGRYTLDDSITRFEVVSGIIVHEYYVEIFERGGGNFIFVDCSRVNGYGKGCKIYTGEGRLPDGVYRLKRFKWVKVLNGSIVRTGFFNIRSDG